VTVIKDEHGIEHVDIQAGSHVVVLAEYARCQHGCDLVIEFGCGYWSTPMLHGLSKASFNFLSYDTDKEWAALFPCTRYVRRYPTPNPEKQKRVGLVFIDCDPPDERMRLALAWRDYTDFIICHDANRSAYRWDFSSFKEVRIYETGTFHTAVLSMEYDL